MPVDTGIYNALLQPPKSALDYQNEFLGAQAQRQKIQQNAIGLQGAQASLADAQRVRDEQAGVRTALAGLPPTSTPDDQVKALRALGTPTALTQADTLATSYGNQLKSVAGAAKDNADAKKTEQQTQWEQVTHGIQSLVASSTPEQARAAVADGVSKGYWTMNVAMQKAAAIPSDPTAYQDWRISQLKAILPTADLLKANAPAISTRNTGGTTDTLASDPLSGRTTVVNSVKNTNSPDAVLQAKTSTANNAANIKKDLAVAGLNPDGGVNANQESMAQLIASGKAPAPTGMAAARPGVAALMARVSQINPDYDATTYNAKNAAAKGFTSGQQGNALRSISTASEHLSQLDKLGDALENGQYPVVNSIGNAYGIQTGQAPAQVFNAVKGVVAQEVVKAIVAGGGSAGERDEAAKAFSNASSPAQLKQTIQAYRTVMQAQKSNLLDQRRAAGLPDSTLPVYAAPGAGAPAGIDPNAIKAELERRGVK